MFHIVLKPIETNYTHLSTAQSRVPPYPKLILAVIMISLSTLLIMEVIVRILINLITINTTAFTHLIDNELLLCMFLSKGCDFSPQGTVLSFHNVQLFAHTVLCVFQIFDIHENISHLCGLQGSIVSKLITYILRPLLYKPWQKSCGIAPSQRNHHKWFTYPCPSNNHQNFKTAN